MSLPERIHQFKKATAKAVEIVRAQTWHNQTEEEFLPRFSCVFRWRAGGKLIGIPDILVFV